jgi:hypothetical protein
MDTCSTVLEESNAYICSRAENLVPNFEAILDKLLCCLQDGK